MGPRPWSCVFVQLAMDSEFWAERVHHLAAAWTASGGKGAPCIATAAADAVQGALGHEQELGQGTSDSRRIQANRDGRQAKKRQTLGHRASAPSSSGKGAGGGRGRGKGKSKDQSGLELCYSWASGKGHCADVAPEGSVRGRLSGSISAALSSTIAEGCGLQVWMNLGTGKKRCMLICSWRGLQLGVQIMCKMCFISS